MKQMLLLTFPAEETGSSTTYELITKYSLEINILRASINFNAQGILLIEAKGEEEKIQQAIDYLSKTKIDIKEINSAIIINKEKCVNCGACTAACSVGALYFDKDWVLQMDTDKCLDCKTCVTACPIRAIEAIL